MTPISSKARSASLTLCLLTFKRSFKYRSDGIFSYTDVLIFDDFIYFFKNCLETFYFPLILFNSIINFLVLL